MNESAEDRNTTERHGGYGHGNKTISDDDDEGAAYHRNHRNDRQGEQPHTGEGDVSDSDVSLILQTHKSHGVNNGEVTLDASQGVKNELSTKVDGHKADAHHGQQFYLSMNATKGGHECKDVDQLHGDHVIRKEIRVARLPAGTLQPLFQRGAEDEDAEGQKYKDVGEDEAVDEISTQRGVEAVEEPTDDIHAGLVAGCERRVDGRRAVDRHFY